MGVGFRNFQRSLDGKPLAGVWVPVDVLESCPEELRKKWVKVKFRNGNESVKAMRGSVWCWYELGRATIVAYKVVEGPDG